MATNGQRASVLEVGIGEMAFVDGPVAIDGQRYVEVAGLEQAKPHERVRCRRVSGRGHGVHITAPPQG